MATSSRRGRLSWVLNRETFMKPKTGGEGKHFSKVNHIYTVLKVPGSREGPGSRALSVVLKRPWARFLRARETRPVSPSRLIQPGVSRCFSLSAPRPLSNPYIPTGPK